MTSYATTAAQEYEAFHIAVRKLASLDGTSPERAAIKIAGLALQNRVAAVGVKLADPEDDEEQSYERQPIPASAWADFLSLDYTNFLSRDCQTGIIRVRVGNQFRALALWRDIHIAVGEPAKQPVKRSRLATQDAIAAAEAYLIDLRQSGAQKPGGNKAGLLNHVMAQFGLNA